MGYEITINQVLRTDPPAKLEVGGVYEFNKAGSKLFVDSFKIWLIDRSWNAIAEITILSQQKTTTNITGRYRVEYIYQGDEQQTISKMFKRMYA